MDIKEELDEIKEYCVGLKKTIPKRTGEDARPWMTKIRGLIETVLTSEGIREDIRSLIPIAQRGQFSKTIINLRDRAATSYSQSSNVDIISQLDFVVYVLNEITNLTFKKGEWVLHKEEQNDVLLPIASRKFFNSDIPKALGEVLPSQPLSLLLADIDYFKVVNDKYGHQVGDEVLKKVASFIKETVYGKGKAYRYGGEEIAILLQNHDAAEAEAVAERIRVGISKISFSDNSLKATISIGVAISKILIDVDSLIKEADDSLYKAKKSGRNKTVVSNL